MVLGSFSALGEEFDPRTLSDGFTSDVLDAIYGHVKRRDELVVESPAALMRHAISAAETTSVRGPLIRGKRGGPFGAATAIPHELKINGRKVRFAEWWPGLSSPEQEVVLVGDIESWRIVSIGVNLVDVENDPTLHGEMSAVHMACKVTGRNGWKRFLAIATTGAPCDMCAGAFRWWRPRYIWSAAGLVDAVVAGFHEGLPPDLVRAMRSDPSAFPLDNERWVTEQRALGAHVEVGLCRDEVVSRLYRPYFGELGGTLYNSGPEDPTG